MSVVLEIPKLQFVEDIEKNWLLDNLKTARMNITFEKVDGTIREMLCTLDSELLPKIEPVVLVEGEVPKEVKPRKESTTAFRVYDLEKLEFRSIRWNSITQIVIL
jgi:hypothetical protein